MSKFYVYGIFEKDCDEPFYIGKGTGSRMYQHFHPSNLAQTTMFYNKLRGMLAQNIRPLVKILHDNLDEETSFTLEIKLIAQFGRRDDGTGCLCNHTNGGEGMSGRMVSNETRLKISMSNSGLQRTLDTRINMAKVWTDSKKREHSEKVSAVLTERRGTPVAKICLRTGNVLKTYPSQGSVKTDGFDQGNVANVVNGCNKSHGGFGWRYV